MNEQATTDTITAGAEDFPKVKMNAGREAAQMIPVTRRGLDPRDLAQLVDVAKTMASAREAVPAHMRNNNGMCLAILEMAKEWGFRAYGVANLCYITNDRMGFEAQLWVAVANQHGNLMQRLRPTYQGVGDERVCIVRGHFKGEVDPCEYRSPTIAKLIARLPNRRDGQGKGGSPLWFSDPDQQQWYYSARAFVRRYCPHIMLGIFGTDELQDGDYQGFEQAKDVTAASDALAQRLAEAKATNGDHPVEGFHANVVEDGLAGDDALAAPQGDWNAGGTTTPGKQEKRTSEAPRGKRGRPRKEKPQETEPEAITTERDETAMERPAPDDGWPGPDVPAATKAKPDDGVGAKPEKPKGPPTTASAYREHLEGWLAGPVPEKGYEAQWASERKLRNACGIIEAERIELRKLVDAKLGID
jgi:hypothetical protein